MASKVLLDGLDHLGLGSLLANPQTQPALGTALVYARRALGLSDVDGDDELLEVALREAMARDLSAPARGMVVRGRVWNAEGVPLRDRDVRVLDRDLRHVEVLGVTKTDAHGRYELAYDASQFVRSEKRRADLVIHAVGDEQRLIESPIQFNAPVVAIVNLLAAPLRPIPEWRQVDDLLRPLLDGVAPDALTDEDTEFLMQEAGLAREVLDAWSTARRLAAQVGGDPVPVYGCVRLRLPRTLAGLAAQPRVRLVAALEGAVAQDLIPALTAPALERFLVLLDRARLRHAVEAADSSPALVTALPDPKARAAFLRLHLAEHLDDGASWEALAKDPALASSLDRLRNFAELAAVTGLHQALLDVMHDLPTLARWQRQEPWTVPTLAAAPPRVITELVATVPPPDWLTGTEAERRTQHAATIERALEQAEPTRRLTARLRDRPREPIEREVVAFLDQHTDFDLRGESVARYLRRTGARLADAPRARLRAFQRLHRVTTSLDEIDALVAQGVTTASRMARVHPIQLSKTLAARGIAPEQTFRTHNHATRLAMLGAFVVQAHGESTQTAAIPSTPLPLDLAGLGAADDLCACVECGAADGPAAYLVDLMHLLRGHALTLVPSAYDQLIQRRPDLATLPLSCHHTLTPLPAIDLVNEQLEHLGGGVLPTLAPPELTAAELRARPQHTDDTAYEALATVTYPWPLPFELGTERVRAALDALGTSRGEMLAMFPPKPSVAGGEPLEDPARLQAREYFGMARAEAELIVGASPPSLSSLFGIDDVNALANVNTLLVRTGLEVEELHALVGHAPAGVGLVWPEGCDTESMTLGGVTEATLRVLGQYVRLSRRLGWPRADLDAVLERLGVTATTPSFPPTLLGDLWRILSWRDRYRVTFAQVLSWLATSSTVDRATSLARALGVSQADLGRLEAKLGTGETVSDLSKFLDQYERVRALGLSGSDFLWLLDAPATPNPGRGRTDAQLAAILHTLIVDLQRPPPNVVPPPDPQTIQREAITQTLARAFELERHHVERVVDSAVMAPALYALATLDPTNDVVVADGHPAMIALRTLERFAFVVRRFALSDAEIAAMATPGAPSWLRLDDLAAGTCTPEAALAVGECAALRRSLANAFEPVTLLAQSVTAGIAALAASEGWSPFLANRFVGTTPFTFAHGIQAHRAAQLLLRLGDHGHVAIELGSNPTPTPGDGAKVLKFARGRLTTAQWAERERIIEDRLRVARRDALLARLSNTLGETPTALTTRLLIDVEVSACQLTSRVKAAIGSVQMFMHRCLMGHESAVDLVPEVARWWRWMQNFRVWQANRKVFLYPENWIEPELRDDKTPIFADLESALSQQDVTQVAVEEGFRGYLRGLHDVARLEIMALHHEQRDGGCTTLHLVGRQWSQPRGYYYRQRIDASRWTPWEKVDADIEGDHVMVTVHNGRPTIVWPLIREERDPDGVTRSSGEPATRQGIRFFWTERTHGRWGAKRSMDPGTMVYARLGFGASTGTFIFRAKSESQRLVVSIQHLYVSGAGEVVSDGQLRRGTVESGEVVLGGCREGAAASDLDDDPVQWILDEIDDREGVPNRRPNRVVNSRFLSVNIPFQQIFKPKAASDDSSATFKLTADLRDPDFASRPFSFQSVRDTFLIEPAKAPYTAYAGDMVGPRGAAAAALGAIVETIAAGAGDATPPPDAPKAGGSATGAPPYFRVSALEHAQACELMARSEAIALVDLLSRETQQGVGLTPKKPSFDAFYGPRRVVKPFPIEGIDFTRGGAYAIYNWELFFHAPYLLAVRLIQNERYEEALTFLQVIFDPTGGQAPGPSDVSRFWKFSPFHQLGKPESVTDLLAALRDDSPDQGQLAAVLEQLDAYREDPFNPHLIARLRPGAYMRSVLMRYLDCLIGWGDKLFRRETIEALNQATLLYILAAELLGRRPRQVPTTEKPAVTVADLLDAHASAEEHIEDVLTIPVMATVGCGKASPLWPVFDTSHFCVPANPTLLGYWDKVADRLFKIRHCQNLEGRTIQLPLFEPPIDPALLVRAAAAGVDIGSVLDGLAAPLPSYRFSVLSQKALELCNDVKALGGELLGILEKRDAESLTRLRAGQEVALLDAVRAMKQAQLAESTQALRALERQRETVELRRAHYQDVLQRMNDKEREAEKGSAAAGKLNKDRAYLEVLAAVFNIGPTFSAGSGGFSISFGFPNIGASVEAVARYLGVLALDESTAAALAATQGGYDRRSEEWDLQGRLATSELKQLDHQLAAAEIRVAMAERDLANHDLQRDNAREVEAHLRAKFTSRELFDWMAREAANAYRAAFRLAYDLSRRAERCFAFERGESARTFIGGAHWDDLRQGLLAGTRLHQELRQMELAYLDENRRDLEITKHVSLSLLDGTALFELRANGSCTIDLPEALFDADYPGHYLRRLKSVAITIPAVIGPHASLNATLTLTSSKLRRSAGELEAGLGNESIVPSIVTSSGQNDSGMFETILRDERYLPFEGAGAISTWRLEIPPERNSFDRDSLTDVILHLRYTARDGGPAFQTAALERLETNGAPLTRLFSIRHDFATAWAAFLRPVPPAVGGTEPAAALTLDLDFTPFAPRRGGKTASLTGLTIIVAGAGKAVSASGPTLAIGGVDESDDAVMLRLFQSGSQAAFAIEKREPDVDVPAGLTVESATTGDVAVPTRIVELGGAATLAVPLDGSAHRRLVLRPASPLSLDALRTLASNCDLLMVASWSVVK